MLITDRPQLKAIPLEWQQPLRNWELRLRAEGKREATIDVRIRHLRRLARDLGNVTPESVTEDDLVQWAGSKNWAPETRHAYYMSVTAFYSWHTRPTGNNPAERVMCGISRQQPPPRPTPEDAVRHALQIANPRTELIIRLAAELGLRCAEIAQVHTRDIDTGEDGCTLTVHGKGGKVRVLPVPLALARLLTHEREDGFIFPGKVNGHLSPRHVSKLARKVLPAPWNLHSLRHRFATVAYVRGGHDLIALQQALGHNNVATTQRYTQCDATALTHLVTATSLT
ncbi:tyrosine-type recombinase/integrase [Corynebacterium aquilae]|uniref:tyrosine-type recombinase/integrase n=1 Tax=Corynebacterium aquilae TaxID=203263 RepID=UPI0009513386|nr:tyrosine-type recombinase/integrase [Corynebacterium aquilae]